MTETQTEIISLLETNCKGRNGIPDLIACLLDSDYFTSPASTKYHGNYKGGLADHSLAVYDSLTLINKEYRDKENRYSDETLTIVALLHDMCKVNTYIEDSEPATDAQIKYLKDLISKEDDISHPPTSQLTKFYVSKVIEYLKKKEGEFPKFETAWKVKDELPLGHGEKSIYLIQKFIDLTDEEAIAIRWHLGGADPGIQFFYPSGVANTQAVRTIPLVSMLVAADYLTSWLIDQKV
jgi:hypothetical protein